MASKHLVPILIVSITILMISSNVFCKTRPLSELRRDAKLSTRGGAGVSRVIVVLGVPNLITKREKHSIEAEMQSQLGVPWSGNCSQQCGEMDYCYYDPGATQSLDISGIAGECSIVLTNYNSLYTHGALGTWKITSPISALTIFLRMDLDFGNSNTTIKTVAPISFVGGQSGGQPPHRMTGVINIQNTATDMLQHEINNIKLVDASFILSSLDGTVLGQNMIFSQTNITANPQSVAGGYYPLLKELQADLFLMFLMRSKDLLGRCP